MPQKPELVVGLVGAAGSKLDKVVDAATGALSQYGYEIRTVSLSGLMRELPEGDALAEIKHEDERISRHMDAGDAIRQQSGRNDAVAGLAITLMLDRRTQEAEGGAIKDTAWILNSLKHPEEVKALRRVYGSRFLLLSVHAPTVARVQDLTHRIAGSHGQPENEGDFAAVAQLLMDRDEREEGLDHGQNVRSTFTEGDVYVATHPEEELAPDIDRYLELFFGNPFLTPKPDEYSMFHAHSAALRSADLSRQVGAAICTERGDIIAVGCNEVPWPKGGQYWPGDNPDQRDFQRGYDSNAKARDDALRAAFDRLLERGELKEDATIEGFQDALKGTRLANITEFGRPAHAEMAALLDAARRGVSVLGKSLYTTTFPCHNCARHVITAGIGEVIYREPYEKSLAATLHPDAIEIDPIDRNEHKITFRRYVGVGPPRYIDLFTAGTRKDKAGNSVRWDKQDARARLVSDETAYRSNEEEYVADFNEAISGVSLEGI